MNSVNTSPLTWETESTTVSGMTARVRTSLYPKDFQRYTKSPPIRAREWLHYGYTRIRRSISSVHYRFLDWNALGQMVSVIENFGCSQRKDTISWGLDPSGIFSVKSFYNAAFRLLPINEMALTIWRIKAPKKVKLTVWLAVHNKLLTAKVLARRNMAHPFDCKLCRASTENANHQFLSCPVAVFIWNRLRATHCVRRLPETLMAFWPT